MSLIRLPEVVVPFQAPDGQLLWPQASWLFMLLVKRWPSDWFSNSKDVDLSLVIASRLEPSSLLEFRVPLGGRDGGASFTGVGLAPGAQGCLFS